MRLRFLFACALAFVVASLSARLEAAEIDARPPDRLTLSTAGSRQIDVDYGGTGSLNYLHYFTPDALFGVGAEHQFIADARLTFGSVRGAWSRGQPASRFSVLGEVNQGRGDTGVKKYDYSVAVLGISQSFTPKFSVQLESRQIDIDTSHGNLPKLTLSYLWTPRLLTSIGYANSVGGNLGTDLTTARIDYYAQHFNVFAGGSTGRADPSVIDVTLTGAAPAVTSKTGFLGLGRTFSRGEVQLTGDYLKAGESEKVTLTVSFTAYLGSRGRPQ